LNVTVPVAVEGVTVAVKVTTKPSPEGFDEEAIVTVELALFTVWERAADVLPL
jgi:molybdenum cofactor biosynthesis enzyme